MNCIAGMALVVLSVLFGCQPDRPDCGKIPKESGLEKEGLLRAKMEMDENEAKAAYDRARTSMLAEKKVFVDVLWVLRQFVKDDDELDTFVAEAKRKVSNPAYVPGVFSDLPRMELPERPGAGIKKFYTYVKAAFGQPEDLALSYIREYIDSDGVGYILTHQFLCLIWAEQAGLPVTDEMSVRKQELWKKIYREQCGVDGVDSVDLYMERVAILLMYPVGEGVDETLASQWISTIVESQLSDGSWPLSKTRIYYDGASTLLSSPRAHTTVLAMMALYAYIDNNPEKYSRKL